MATHRNLDDLYSFGLDEQRRRLYFGYCTDSSASDGHTVTAHSIELLIRGLHRLEALSSCKPISLYMSSHGGDAYAMLRLYDEILTCSCPIKFYGGGLIMSAATWIMAVCDERYLYPNTTVMVHDGYEEAPTRHTDLVIHAAEAKRFQEKLCELYAANSRMPKSFWEDICKRDSVLSAEEAVKLGLADKIIEPKKRDAFRRIRNAALKQKVVDLDTLVKDVYARVGLNPSK